MSRRATRQRTSAWVVAVVAVAAGCNTGAGCHAGAGCAGDEDLSQLDAQIEAAGSDDSAGLPVDGGDSAVAAPRIDAAAVVRALIADGGAAIVPAEDAVALPEASAAEPGASSSAVAAPASDFIYYGQNGPAPAGVEPKRGARAPRAPLNGGPGYEPPPIPARTGVPIFPARPPH